MTRWIVLAVTAGALVVSGTGCRRGGLAYWADRARAEGLTSISYGEIVCVVPGTLADAVDDWTVLVAEPVSSPATQTHTDTDISTWHLLRVTEVLSTPRRKQAACTGLPPANAWPGRDELAVEVSGGTAVVDGIAITEASSLGRKRFEVGDRYLLIAHVCPDGRAWFPHGGGVDVVTLGADNRVTTPRPRWPVTLVDEIVELKTLDRVAERVRQLLVRRARGETEPRATARM